MITSLSKIKGKGKRKGEKGNEKERKREKRKEMGKKTEKDGIWLTQDIKQNLLGEKIIFFPQGERISYIFVMRMYLKYGQKCCTSGEK